jgi:hypothetical protein
LGILIWLLVIVYKILKKQKIYFFIVFWILVLPIIMWCMGKYQPNLWLVNLVLVYFILIYFFVSLIYKLENDFR